MTPLQKRATYSFAIGLLFAIIMVAVFVIKGDITDFDKDLSFRLVIYALWIAVPLVYLLLVNPILRKPEIVDERDKLILIKSTRIQLAAVIISVLIWVVILTEVYWGSGQVPVVFLTLLIISTLVISTLAQSLGILVEYWKER